MAKRTKRAEQAAAMAAKAAIKAKKKRERTPHTWKAMSRISAKAGAAAGSTLIEASWRAATGRKPPKQPDSPEVPLRESLTWLIISNSAVAIAKSMATRRAAIYFEQSTGALPPLLRRPTPEGGEPPLIDPNTPTSPQRNQRNQRNQRHAPRSAVEPESSRRIAVEPEFTRRVAVEPKPNHQEPDWTPSDSAPLHVPQTPSRAFRRNRDRSSK